MLKREETFNSGIGLTAGTPGATDYSVLVFVKNCLLTRPMRLGQFEVVPFGGLAVSDVVDFVQAYLRERTTGIEMPDGVAKKVADEGRVHRPSFVAHFPLVRAEGSVEARRTAAREAQLLCGVLSLTRLAYPTPFAVLSVDRETKRCELRIWERDYAGNLAVGPMAGEYPEATRKLSSNARGNETLRLYLSLYRDALREFEPESSYFRLWSLLEAMAERTIAKKQDVLLDWSGRPVLSPTGKQQFIQHNDQIAFEYLRRTVGAWPVNFNYSSEVQQSNWDQLVAIWYRHRNCMAHSGGCLPNDPTHCDPKSPKYVSCKAAYDEVLAVGTDRYRTILRDTVGQCLKAEFA